MSAADVQKIRQLSAEFMQQQDNQEPILSGPERMRFMVEDFKRQDFARQNPGTDLGGIGLTEMAWPGDPNYSGATDPLQQPADATAVAQQVTSEPKPAVKPESLSAMRPEAPPAQPDATGFEPQKTIGMRPPARLTERVPTLKEVVLVGIDKHVKPVLKDAYNRSLSGLAEELMTGRKGYDLSGYEPNVIQDIAATVFSFFSPLDIVTLGAGSAVGRVAVAKYGPRIVRKLVANGVAEQTAIKAVSKAGQAVAGGTSLGAHGGTGAALSGQGPAKIAEQTLKSGALGFILGGTGALMAGKSGAARLGAEIGAFTAGSAGLEGRLPNKDDLVRAVGIVLGLKGVRRASEAVTRGVGELLVSDVATKKGTLSEAVRRIAEGSEIDGIIERAGETPQERAKRYEAGTEVALEPARAGKAPQAQEPASTKEVPGETGEGPLSVEFVSPNIEENLTYEQASKRLSSPEHVRLRKVFEDIDKASGHKSEIKDVIGDWADGAENSLRIEKQQNVSFEDLKRSAAKKGEAGRQKEVGVFQENPEGSHRLYRLAIPVDKADTKTVREDLTGAGIEFRSLGQGENSTVVEVVGKLLDKKTENAIVQLAEKYDVDVEAYTGQAEFFGGPTRAEGLREFKRVLGESEQEKPDSRHDGQAEDPAVGRVHRRDPPGSEETPPAVAGEPPSQSKPPSKTEPPPEEGGKIIGLNKAEQDRIRRHTGLDQLDPPERKTWERTLGEAKEGKYDQSALTTAEEVIKSNRPITDTEHAGMVLKAADLANQYDASVAEVASLISKGNKGSAELERGHGDALLRQIDDLTNAGRLAGRNAGRALSIRRMMVNREDLSLAGVMRAATARKGAKLTSKETAKIEKVAAELAAAEQKVRELEEQHTKDLANKDELRAELVATRTRNRIKRSPKSQSAEEVVLLKRVEIKKMIADIGYRVNDITGVSVEGAYLIGQLAVNYIQGGAHTLKEVVRKVRADVPELTERDVHQALITKDPRLQRKAKEDATKRVAQLKKQAQLLIDIEKAEQGVFDAKKGRQPQPFEIKRLQRKLRELRTEAYRSTIEAQRLEKAVKTINELQDQLTNHLRTVREKKPIDPEELATAKEQIKGLRRAMHVEDQLARYEEQLRTGEFEIREKPVEKKLPPDLERKEVQLRVARKKVRQAIDEMAPFTKTRMVLETTNILRTLKATADMSAVARQGLVLSVMRPKLAAKAFGKSFKAFFSEYTAEQIENSIQSADHHYIREKSGLYLSPLGEGKPSAREEMFMSTVLQKVPGVGAVVKASERHMVSHLNLIRVGAFDEFLAKYPNATHAELKAWAHWVNVASGRGDIGAVGKAGKWLSTIVFAPRFAASRIQTPYMVFRHWKQPRVRKEIAKDMVGVVGLGMTALALGAAAGFEVGTDPREADFGKMRLGDTRIDLWAGMQQPVRLITRIGLAATDYSGLTGKDLSEREKVPDPLEMMGRFARWKLAPAVTLPVELYRGRTAVGEPVTPTETAIRAIMPLVYEDIYEAYKLEGFSRAGLVGGLTFYGVGASTYSDSKSRVRRDIKRMVREDSYIRADEKRRQWNMKNPDSRISRSILIRK